jgi:hypothetical protein
MIVKIFHKKIERNRVSPQSSGRKLALFEERFGSLTNENCGQTTGYFKPADFQEVTKLLKNRQNCQDFSQFLSPSVTNLPIPPKELKKFFPEQRI